MRSAKADDTRWAELCAQVSWNDIRDVHRQTKLLAEHDFEALALMTVAAARRWALDDMGKIGGIEQRFLVSVPENAELPCERWPLATKEAEEKLLADGARLLKGFTDLIITKRFSEGDRHVVVDWKTAGDVGPAWRDRLQHSWQAKLYCWANQSPRCVFRGVQRDGRTAEVVVEWPVLSPVTGNVAFNDSDAEQYVRSAFAIRESQTSAPWARAMPHACNAFGRPCEHLPMCNENTHPGGIPSGPLSYSGIETMLLCPERYRLGKLLAVADEDTDARTALGRAFHSGMEALYQQLARLA